MNIFNDTAKKRLQKRSSDWTMDGAGKPDGVIRLGERGVGMHGLTTVCLTAALLLGASHMKLYAATVCARVGDFGDFLISVVF